MHSGKVAGKIRAQIRQFSGEVPAGLPKTAARPVREVIYAVQCWASARLSEIGRALQEGMPAQESSGATESTTESKGSAAASAQESAAAGVLTSRVGRRCCWWTVRGVQSRVIYWGAPDVLPGTLPSATCPSPPSPQQSSCTLALEPRRESVPATSAYTSRQRLASIRLPASELPRQGIPVTQQVQETVQAQLVVIVEILVVQAQPQDPLLNQRLDGMLDPI